LENLDPCFFHGLLQPSPKKQSASSFIAAHFSMQFQSSLQISLITGGNFIFSIGISDIISLIHKNGKYIPVEERASVCCLNLMDCC